MEGIRTKMDLVRGVVRYLQHDTEATCSVYLEHPINIQYNGQERIQFKLLGQDIVYNHFDYEAQQYEGVNHPLTGTAGEPFINQYIQVQCLNGIVLGQDINTFTQTHYQGTYITLPTASAIHVHAGTYKFEMSGCADFSNANGILYIALLNHANHQYITNPDIKSSLGICAGNHTLDYGHASHSFIVTFAVDTDVCFRTIQLNHFTYLLYFNVIVQKM